MKRFKCSEDCFDAIFECSCTKMLCSKHNFSHQKNFPDHKIERIRIPINNESRQILINFVIKIKKMLVLLYHKDIEWDIRKGEYYELLIHCYCYWIVCLNILLLSLIKARWIPMKLFFTPFEYFLHQLADKAVKYISDFIFPTNFKYFLDDTLIDYLFYFNYFIFEDTNYIFGWYYNHVFHKFFLKSVCLTNLCELLDISEYEVAYEIINNYISLAEMESRIDFLFFRRFKEILGNFIKEKKFLNLIAQWKKIEALLLKLPDYYYLFYDLSSKLFNGLKTPNLASYCFKKIEEKIQNDIHKDEFKNTDIVRILAERHWDTGNFKKAKKYFKQFIRISSLHSNYTKSKDIIITYYYLASYYLHYKKKEKVNKIIQLVESFAELNKDAPEVDEQLYIFYYYIEEFDKAYKILLRLIKMYRKKRINNSPSLSKMYLHLEFIYRAKGDNKKAHWALYNAKSCAGILPMSSNLMIFIYIEFGNYYLKNGYYKDALYHYKSIINYCNDTFVPKLKFGIGMSYYYMANFDKSLKYLIDVEVFYSSIQNKDIRELFKLNVLMGLVYYELDSKAKASCYYIKAFELINNLEIKDQKDDLFLRYIYDYFYRKYDYKKCQVILQLKTIFLNSDTNLAYKSQLFIDLSDLYFEQNKREEAEKYLCEAEKIIDLENFLRYPKRRIDLEWIKNYIFIAYQYSNYKRDNEKAKKICKTIDLALDASLPINLYNCYNAFLLLQEIYIIQGRWIKAKKYNQKLFKILKEMSQNEYFNVDKANIGERIKLNNKIAENINKNL